MALKRYDQVSCACDYPSDNLEEIPDGDLCYYEDAIKEIHDLVFENETLKRQLYKIANECKEMLEIFSENNDGN